MPYIYKITNTLNGKMYIGKTNFTIEKRWREHCQDSQKETLQKRPLYSAMKKYGIENFSIEEIEQLETPQQAEEREKYWIEYYGSFKNGYNATIGGDGRTYIDYQVVYETYNQLKNCKKVSEKLNIDYGYVCLILKSHGIQLTQPIESLKNINQPKLINMYDLQENYLQTFSSASDAARWCVENNFSKRLTSGVRSHIIDCANGKRKTAYQHKWRYV